jgi:hypothetical protein
MWSSIWAAMIEKGYAKEDFDPRVQVLAAPLLDIPLPPSRPASLAFGHGVMSTAALPLKTIVYETKTVINSKKISDQPRIYTPSLLLHGGCIERLI